MRGTFAALGRFMSRSASFDQLRALDVPRPGAIVRSGSGIGLAVVPTTTIDELTTVAANARWATAAIATSVLMFGVALGVLSESRRTVNAIVGAVSEDRPETTGPQAVADDPLVVTRDAYG
ncbi:MAG: hypothetical protein HYZ27_02825, partial [Deltaproteobacteria bacterium]|nr:hypothetical protein [Deltaproteobacteria bacterium]